jgi:hypothetical protein
MINPRKVESGAGYEATTGAVHRAFGTFSEPRNLGCYLITSLVIVLMINLKKQKLIEKPWVRFLMLGLIMIAIISTISTSTYIVAIIMAIIVLFYMRSTQAIKLLAFLSCVVIMGTVIDAFLFSSKIYRAIEALAWRRFTNLDLELVASRFMDTGVTTSQSFSWIGYSAMYREALDIWLTSPIIGVGLNNLEYHTSSKIGYWSFFALIGQVGLVGLTGQILIYYFMIKRYLIIIKEEHDDNIKIVGEIGMFLIITQILSTFVSFSSFITTFYWTNLSLAFLILINLERRREMAKKLLNFKKSAASNSHLLVTRNAFGSQR